MMLLKIVSVACLLGISLLKPVVAYSQQSSNPPLSVTLAWSPSPNGAVTGYNLYYGRMFVSPTNRLDVRTGLTATVTNLEAGLTYFFYATAYNASGLESEPSNLITYTPAPVVSLSLNKSVVSETDSVGAVVTVSRSGSTVAPMIVMLNLSGTARSGADFLPLPASVVIPAGAASATMALIPVNNLIVSPEKTVTLSLVPNVSYQFGTSASITLHITNQDVDSDQDGMSNAAEQLAGTGVNDASSNLRIHSMSRGPNGQMTVRWGSVPGISYRILFSSSLANATWTPISPSITASGNLTTWTFAPTNTAGIYGLGF